LGEGKQKFDHWAKIGKENGKMGRWGNERVRKWENGKIGIYAKNERTSFTPGLSRVVAKYW
jgi:hypothetical protein